MLHCWRKILSGLTVFFLGRRPPPLQLLCASASKHDLKILFPIQYQTFPNPNTRLNSGSRYRGGELNVTLQTGGHGSTDKSQRLSADFGPWSLGRLADTEENLPSSPKLFECHGNSSLKNLRERERMGEWRMVEKEIRKDDQVGLGFF